MAKIRILRWDEILVNDWVNSSGLVKVFVVGSKGSINWVVSTVCLIAFKLFLSEFDTLDSTCILFLSFPIDLFQ